MFFVFFLIYREDTNAKSTSKSRWWQDCQIHLKVLEEVIMGKITPFYANMHKAEWKIQKEFTVMSARNSRNINTNSGVWCKRIRKIVSVSI